MDIKTLQRRRKKFLYIFFNVYFSFSFSSLLFFCSFLFLYSSRFSSLCPSSLLFSSIRFLLFSISLISSPFFVHFLFSFFFSYISLLVSISYAFILCHFLPLYLTILISPLLISHHLHISHVCLLLRSILLYHPHMDNFCVIFFPFHSLFSPFFSDSARSPSAPMRRRGKADRGSLSLNVHEELDQGEDCHRVMETHFHEVHTFLRICIYNKHSTYVSS